MASHRDLLDAIARVRAATGNRDSWQNGLSGEDIAVACSAWSSPPALGAVLAKIVAAHPDAFLVEPGPMPPAPRVNEGLAADAIRGAEAALAQQNSTAAQVDLQVVTAVLNAHAANADGAAELEKLQHELESAVLSRTDLDTPAGAREFQRFLIGKLRDIRTVVDTAGLDATSKASLAAALAALYASVTPPHTEPPHTEPSVPESPPRRDSPPTPPGGGAPRATASGGPAAAEPFGRRPDAATESRGLGDLPPIGDFGPAGPAPAPPPIVAPAPPPIVAPAPPPAPAAFPAPEMAAPAMAPPAPAWGGGLPAGMPFGAGGLSAPPPPDPGRPDTLPDRAFGGRSDRVDEPRDERDPHPPDGQPDEARDEALPEGPATVHLPDGGTVTAPSPEVAAAMTAAIAGTPIPEAFRQQGITLPAPGSAVTAPVEVTRLIPGDIGILPDRLALALGDGDALIDGQIRAIAAVTGPGFLGWQHPPAPEPPEQAPEQPPAPEVPAPTRPVETAPS